MYRNPHHPPPPNPMTETRKNATGHRQVSLSTLPKNAAGSRQVSLHTHCPRELLQSQKCFCSKRGRGQGCAHCAVHTYCIAQHVDRFLQWQKIKQVSLNCLPYMVEHSHTHRLISLNRRRKALFMPFNDKF